MNISSRSNFRVFQAVLLLLATEACFGVKYDETDTDSDGLMDFVDPDDDNDGASDLVELRCKSDPKASESRPTPPEASDTSEEALGCRTALGGACNIARPDGATAGQFCQVEGRTGNCAAGVWVCEEVGLVCRSTNISGEVCDGLDNDCDGTVDDLASNGCFTGLLGACSQGTQTCTNGAASECVPSVQPSSEVCDGIDNDCDGAVDDRIAGVGEECTTGLGGACAQGTQQCAGNTLRCVPPEGRFEVCNGLDDDCDGAVDDAPQGAGSGCQVEGQRGVCAVGALACVRQGQGATMVCMGPAPAPTEICSNGLDDDCDGVVDNGNNCECNNDRDGDGYGVGGGCRGPDCDDDDESVHPGVNDPCNGVDDDCDGATDEDFVSERCQALPPAQGACLTNGMKVCMNGRESCQAGAPASEVCDGVDNDCNGMADDGQLPAPFGSACTTQQSGACSPGTFVCQRGSQVCQPNVAPGTETCNGLDDDCNGQPDNGFSPTCTGETWGETCNPALRGICSGGLSCVVFDTASAEGTCVKNCDSRADCLSGQVCLRTGVSGTTTTKVCLSVCEAGVLECPAGQRCTPAGICTPALCNPSAPNNGGCPPAAPNCQPQGFCLP